MEINRNQYFMVGLILLFLGIQFRMIDSYVLSQHTTEFLAKQTGKPTVVTMAMPAAGPLARKVLHPPEWLGWAMMSVGSVLILHSLALPKPSG